VTSNDEERPFSATNATGSTSRQRRSTTIRASAPTTTSNTLWAIRSSNTAPFPSRGRHDHAKDTGLPCSQGDGRCRAVGPRPSARRRSSTSPAPRLDRCPVRDRGTEPRCSGCGTAGTTRVRAGLSDHHQQGADLVFQIGTAYFGCRDPDGSQLLDRASWWRRIVESAPVTSDRDQVEPGRQTRAGGHVAGRQGRARRSRRIRGIEEGVDCASVRLATAAFGDEDRLHAGLRGVGGRRRPDCRSGSSRQWVTRDFWHLLAALMQPSRTGRRLHHHRWRRRRHWCGSAWCLLIRSPCPSAWASPGCTDLRGGRHSPTTWYFIGSGKLGPCRERGGVLRSGGRQHQCGAGGDDGDRLHPEPEVPHRPVPDGCGHPEFLACAALEPVSKGVRCANYLKEFRKELVKVVEAVGVRPPRADHPR
jgi:hypothetical protein